MHSRDIEWSSASCSNESPWVKDTCVDVQLELLGSFLFFIFAGLVGLMAVCQSF